MIDTELQSKNADTFDSFLDQYGDFIIAPWTIGIRGVSKEWVKYDKKGEVIASGDNYASPIAVLPTAILKNVDNHTEKLELSYYKQGRWQRLITERSVAANKNAIIRLADKGLEVNSDNSVYLVSYIADVVAQNQTLLPYKPAKSVLGWVDGDFMPYTDKIVFDGEDQFKHLFNAVCSKGDLAQWVDFIRPLRNNLEMRLCMAASFASPLIELIGENPFVFHLWGGTGAGKTIALMVAMSVWGDPAMGKMTRTMNMTANSMLSTAAFLRNLPFAGDELQTIKSRWSNYDNLIMCITEGIDRGRMSYDKVNEIRAWKCSFIFSGEEPCIKQESGGGAKNRVIEVECKDKLVQNGNAVANFVRRCYGLAGKPYIDRLKGLDVVPMYNDLFMRIMEFADTTDKQAGSMAILLLADAIASELFWPGERKLTVSDISKYLCSASEVDISERAYQFVCGAIAENASAFSTDAKQCWGSIEVDGVYINKNVLCRIMADAGFDFEAVKAKWAEKGYLQLNAQGKYSVQRRFNGGKARFIHLALSDEQAVPDDFDLPL